MKEKTGSDSECSAPNGGVSLLFAGLGILYVTCLVLSNLVAGKLFALGDFGFGDVVLPAAVILFPLTYVLGDVFTEVYGFRRMRFVIWTGFGCSFLAVAVYAAVLALPHPAFWNGQEAYRTVFATTPRVFAASLAGYLFGEFSNAVVLSKMKVAMSGRLLWVRTILSSVVGEGLDTVLFIGIAFAGTVPVRALPTMVLFQYLWKVAYEALLTPVTYAAVTRLKKAEGLDAYDRDERYRLF